MQNRSFTLIPLRNSSREQLLEMPGHRHFLAKTRESLKLQGSDPINVYVISGPKFRGRLFPEQQNLLAEFSNALVFYRERELNSEIAAWKLSASHLEFLKKKARANVYNVAWDYGPIPVVQIGTCNGAPVCMTPVVPERKQRRLFKKQQIDDEIVLRVLEEHLQACLREYLSDVADLLRGACLCPKSVASQICRKAQDILQKSAAAKLKFVTDHQKGSPVANSLRRKIRDEQALELLFFEAGIAVAQAALGCLRYCIGELTDPSSLVDAAYKAVQGLGEDFLEYSTLHRCVSLLDRPPANDELSPIDEESGPLMFWVTDLLFACRFISETRKLILESGGTYPLFIFVSHHMAIYSSEAFFRHVREHMRDRFNGAVVVWTGTGRQESIQLSILAKIWLSDVQLLYLSNSLDQFEGGPKELKIDSDWVLEEIVYGAILDKSFHITQAHGNEEVRKSFLHQLQSFQWQNMTRVFSRLHTSVLFEDFVLVGKALAVKVEQHLKDVIFSTHYPTGSRLEQKDGDQLVRGCVIAGLKQKLSEMLWGLRLGITSDHWLVVQALTKASNAKFQKLQNREVTPSEIQHEMRGQRRKDQLPITTDWITKTLLQLRLKFISLGKTKLYLVSHRNRTTTFAFGLTGLINDFKLAYNVDIKPDHLIELDEIMQDAITRPVGENHAYTEVKRFTKRAGI